MVKSVEEPHPKRGLSEESVLLAKRIQLRVSVQYPRRDELVEDTDDEGREYSEYDVVQREGPGFVGDLS